MRYIIMAGGKYNEFDTPKQLLTVNGEILIKRTIRQLKENGDYVVINDYTTDIDHPDGVKVLEEWLKK